jgi:hypothetical protein
LNTNATCVLHDPAWNATLLLKRAAPKSRLSGIHGLTRQHVCPIWRPARRVAGDDLRRNSQCRG